MSDDKPVTLDRVLRAAEEFEAIAKKYGMVDQPSFSDLLDAIDFAVQRVYGVSMPWLARQEQLHLLREIHSAVVKKVQDGSVIELRKRAMNVVMARGRWNFAHTVDHLAKLFLEDAATPAQPAGAETTKGP